MASRRAVSTESVRREAKPSSSSGAVAGSGDDQAIHHDLDVVLFRLGELDPVGQLDRHAVDAGAGVAVGAGLLQQVIVGALAAAGHRSQHLEAGAGRQRGDLVDDLLGRLGVDRPAAVWAVGRADAGKEHAQVVIDLGDGAHRRAGVLADRLLLDGDGRAEAADEIDLGLFHLAEELAGVGGERLDVAALAFGVERVKGQAALAAARDAGDDHQLVARQGQVDVLEVMLLSAANDQLVLVHTLSL